MHLMRWAHPHWLSNTFLVYDRPGGEGMIVDSGAAAGPVVDAVRAERLAVQWIVNTHHHIDHVENNAALASVLGAQVAAHGIEAPLIAGPVRALADGETIACGDLSGRVLHIPGHTRGHLALLVNGPAGEASVLGGGCVFTGDTLFRQSVGGTRAPGHATFPELRRSILERLLVLPPRTAVHPGHGGSTTVGEELDANPFVRAWQGRDPEGSDACLFDGRRARLLVWARDYDGGWKAWIRFADGAEEVVPGSRVTRT